MVNRLRQYIPDHELDTFSMIGSSMGCVVALHYAQRFDEVKSLLLLAPLLSYDSLPMNGEMLAKWEREGATELFHDGLNEEIPLRYDFHLDGLRYHEQIPPPVPIRIIHGKNDETISLEHSKKYAATYPDVVAMKEIDSDRMLHDHLDFIWEQVAFHVGFTRIGGQREERTS